MVISSAMLFYQLSKKLELVEKSAPSNKLEINAIRFYKDKTEVGNLYLVDCRRLDKAIVAKKPCSLIFINAEELKKDFIPKNCDYAIFKDVKNFFDLSEYISDCVNEIQAWDSELKEGIVQRTPLDEYAKLTSKFFNDSLFILTHNFSMLSLSDRNFDFLYDDEIEEEISNDDEEFTSAKFGRKLKMKYVRRLLSDREYEKSLEKTDTYKFISSLENEFLCENIYSEGRYIARLMAPTIYYNGELDEGFVQLFTHYFKYIKRVYLRYTDDPLIKNSQDKLHILIHDMLYNPQAIDSVDANLILQNYGWSVNNRYTVLVFNFFKNSKWDEMTEYICGKLEDTWSNSCAIINDNDIVWVYNHSIKKDNSDDAKFFHVLAYLVRDFACKAGVSDEFRNLNRVSSYLTQANVALLTGQKNNPNKWYYKFSEYSLDYIYEQIMKDLSYDQIIHKSVRTLIDYDKKNGTEYLITLKSYIYNNCNSTHTADELYIHRTTLIRRIERILELCDIDLDDTSTHLYLTISFWILEKMNFEFNRSTNNEDEE